MSRAKHGTRYGSQGIASSLRLDVVLVAYLAEFVSDVLDTESFLGSKAAKSEAVKSKAVKIKA